MPSHPSCQDGSPASGTAKYPCLDTECVGCLFTEFWFLSMYKCPGAQLTDVMNWTAKHHPVFPS